jgi:hypothetical protein
MNSPELIEQHKVVVWCHTKGIKIGATAQSTYTTSWNQLRRNKMAGTVKGLPDLILIIPAKYRKDGQSVCVFLEMKRIKGGVVSPEQKDWISALKGCWGVYASVAHGADDAIDYLSAFIQVEPPPSPPMTSDELESFIHTL